MKVICTSMLGSQLAIGAVIVAPFQTSPPETS